MTELRAGRSGDRIPVGARFSAPVQTGPGAHPASCTMGTGSFPGVKGGRGLTLTPHPLLVRWSRKSRAIPLLPHGPYGLPRVHFTLTFISGFRAISFPTVCRGLPAFLSPLFLLICLLLSMIQPGILLFFRPKDKQEKIGFSALPLVYTDDKHGCITALDSMKMALPYFPLVATCYVFSSARA